MSLPDVSPEPVGAFPQDTGKGEFLDGSRIEDEGRPATPPASEARAEHSSSWLGFAEWDWVQFSDGADELLHAVESLMNAADAEWRGEGTTACGLSGELWIPGMGARMGDERCPGCCEARGYPIGKGSPKNDDVLRPLVEARLEATGGTSEPDAEGGRPYPEFTGWTKDEYDKCPELASRLHGALLTAQDELAEARASRDALAEALRDYVQYMRHVGAEESDAIHGITHRAVAALAAIDQEKPEEEKRV